MRLVRKALVVGIDNYSFLPRLYGCVNDARSVQSMLARHGDGTVNFGVQLLSAPCPGQPIPRKLLREKVRELFTGPAEIALLYFAGHGCIDPPGGYLCASDSHGDDGLPPTEVLPLPHQTRAPT